MNLVFGIFFGVIVWMFLELQLGIPGFFAWLVGITAATVFIVLGNKDVFLR